MKKVIAYVDGFNLYHGIDTLGDNRLKWLDLWALAQGMCADTDEKVAAVYYFSAYATWRGKDSQKRHRDYVRALTARGVTFIEGNFKEKPRKCKNCLSRWHEHEEKETDVHIAVQLIHDAHLKSYDHAFLITGDSDQAPTVKRAKAIHPAGKITIWLPPNRTHGCNSLGDPRRDIRKARIERCQLPDRVLAPDGSLLVERPLKFQTVV